MYLRGIACLIFVLLLLITSFLILLESAAWKQSLSSSASMPIVTSTSSASLQQQQQQQQQQLQYLPTQRAKEIGTALMRVMNVIEKTLPSTLPPINGGGGSSTNSISTATVSSSSSSSGGMSKIKERLTLAAPLSNGTYNPCKLPYQYACHLADQATVQNIADSENSKLEMEVLKSDMFPHPFYQKCMRFVEMRNAVSFLSTDADFLQIMETIRKRTNILEEITSQLQQPSSFSSPSPSSSSSLGQYNYHYQSQKAQPENDTIDANLGVNPEELYRELSKKINLREPFALHLRFGGDKLSKTSSAYLNIEYDLDYGSLNNDKRILTFIADLLEAVYFKPHRSQPLNRKRINGNANEIIRNAMAIHRSLFPPPSATTTMSPLESLTVDEMVVIGELFPELKKVSQRQQQQRQRQGHPVNPTATATTATQYADREGEYKEEATTTAPHWLLPVYVNRDDLRRYIRARHLFPRKDWINYMFFTALKSFLQQLMGFSAFLSSDEALSSPNAQHEYHTRLCQTRFKELFPIQHCHWLRDRIHPNIDQLQLFIDGLISEWNQWTYEQNPFQLNLGQQMELQKHLQELKIYLAQCTIENAFVKKTKDHFGKTNQRILEVEKDLLSMQHLSYVKWVWKIFQTPEITIRRHSGMRIYTEISELFTVGWNAWYQVDLHAIVFPPGALNFISSHLQPGSCQMHAIAGTLFFHEIFHAIQRKLETFKPPVTLRLQQCLIDRYSRLPGVSSSSSSPNSNEQQQQSDSSSKIKSDPEENAADYFALRISFLNWKRKIQSKRRRQEEDIRCFLISYVQIFCDTTGDEGSSSSSGSSVDDNIHAKDIQRALYPIAEMLQDEWESIFHCPPSKSFLGIQKKDKCL